MSSRLPTVLPAGTYRVSPEGAPAPFDVTGLYNAVRAARHAALADGNNVTVWALDSRPRGVAFALPDGTVGEAHGAHIGERAEIQADWYPRAGA